MQSNGVKYVIRMRMWILNFYFSGIYVKMFVYDEIFGKGIVAGLWR